MRLVPEFLSAMKKGFMNKIKYLILFMKPFFIETGFALYQ